MTGQFDINMKPKIAWFSPLPPDKGGVALYSAELIPFLLDFADILLVTNHEREVLPESLRSLPIVPFDRVDDTLQQDMLCVYNIMNNTEQSAASFATLLRHPGVTILHDLNIHGFLLECLVRRHKDHLITQSYTKTGNTDDAYTYALATSHGFNGRMTAYHVLTKGEDPHIASLPCYGVILKHSDAVIVHGKWSATTLRKSIYHTPVFVMPLGMEEIPIPDQSVTDSIREKYGIPPHAFVVTSAGFLSHSRRLDILVRACAYLKTRNIEVHLLFAGSVPNEHAAWLCELARASHLDDTKQLHFTGFLSSDQEFINCLAASDAVAHLRFPTNGETSATTLRALALGKPVMVSDSDNFRDLPPNCCVQIPPNHPNEDLIIAEHIEWLMSEQVYAERSRNATEYVRQYHAWKTVAGKFKEIVTPFLKTPISS